MRPNSMQVGMLHQRLSARTRTPWQHSDQGRRKTAGGAAPASDQWQLVGGVQVPDGHCDGVSAVKDVKAVLIMRV